MEAEKVPLRVCIWYAPEDEDLLQELEAHLSGLEWTQDIVTWTEGDIGPGEDRPAVVEREVRRADIILLLVSAYLIRLPSNEMFIQQSLDRARLGEVVVVPVLVKPFHWQGTPLSALRALPGNGIPVVLWGQRDEAWADVVTQLSELVRDLRQRRQQGPVGAGI